MSKVNDPMYLWGRVCKTNPAMAKEANNGRFKFTTVDPQYQLECATKIFGPYGDLWGMRNFVVTTLPTDPPSMMLQADFFYPGLDGKEKSFPVVVDMRLKPGDDVCKKLITSARSKALSWLGFNADVFLGKFDDAAYVKDLRIRFDDEDKFTKHAVSSIGMAKDGKALDQMSERVVSLLAEGNITEDKARELQERIDIRREQLAAE